MIGKKLPKSEIDRLARQACGVPLTDANGVLIEGSSQIQYTDKYGETSFYTVEGWNKRLAICEIGKVLGNLYTGDKIIYVNPKNVRVM